MAIVNGYCTLAEAKAYGVPQAGTDATDDSVIEAIIEGVSRDIDAYTGRKFYTRTETRYFDVPSYGDGRLLLLDDDLLSVTSLTNGDGTTISSTDYVLLPYNETPKYAIVLKQSFSGSFVADASGNTEKVLAIAGTWGYATAIPHNIREACKETFKLRYNRRFGAGVEGTATITPAGVVITPQGIFPQGVIELLGVYRRVV